MNEVAPMLRRIAFSPRTGLAAALLCLAMLLGGFVPGAQAASVDDEARAAILVRVKEFLNLYERNDQGGVVAMIDAREFSILGDTGERFTTTEQLKGMMARSFGNWVEPKFTDLRDVDVRVGKDLATAHFLFTFQTSDQPAMPIRVVTTWRKEGKVWNLTQCASWVMQAR
jgi:ketosteroid isomerase-like protein